MIRQKGMVNLVDLLVALAVLGVLLGVLLPSYQAFTERQLQIAALNRLKVVLQQARTLASLIDKEVELCPAANSESCSASRLGKDLLLRERFSGQPLHFYQGARVAIAFPDAAVTLRPLPQRSTGATLLPCSGFKQTSARAITFSPTGRVRIRIDPSASLINRC